MTKEEIQKEYDYIIPQMGERVYHALVPLLEVIGMGQRAYFLSCEMGKLKAEEAAACQKPVLVPDPVTK